MGWQNHPCETTSDVSGKFVLGVGGSGSAVLGEVRFSESVVKNLPEMQEMPGDAGSIPESGRSPGGGNGDPLQYSCLENPIHRGAWLAVIHRVAQSRTQMKQFSTGD